jgi:hypothetical protein
MAQKLPRLMVSFEGLRYDDAKESSLAAALMMIRLGRILACAAVVRLIEPRPIQEEIKK